MPVFNNALAGAAGSGGADDYTIERSLRFDSGDSAYLTRTPSSPGNRRTWTWSGWIKTTTSSTYRALIEGYRDTPAGANRTSFQLNNVGKLHILFDNGNSGQLLTSAQFRDPSSWFHVVLAVDTTQSTPANRVKIYVNGRLLESSDYDTTVYPSQDYGTGINNNQAHYINRVIDPKWGDWYAADIHLVDGLQLAASDFGEYDADTGVWNPIKYTGSYSGSAVGSGAVYSDGVSSPQGLQSSNPATNAFDGSTSTGATTNTVNGSPTLTVTFNPPLTNVTSLRMHTGNIGSNQYATGYGLVNGTSISHSTLGASYGSGWVDFTGHFSGTTVNSMGLGQTNAGSYALGLSIDAIEVNGTILQDGTPAGVNGFHLDFDPDAADDYSGGGTFTGNTAGTSKTPIDLANAFDGDITTYALHNSVEQVAANTDIVLNYTFPGTGVAVSNSLRVYVGSYSHVSVNGGSTEYSYTSTSGGEWIDISAAISGSNFKLTSLNIRRNIPATGNYRAALAAVEVDGKILVDGVAPGVDATGAGNHWTPNNLVSSGILSNVTQTVTITGNTSSGRGPYSKTAPKPTSGDAITDPEYSGSLQSGNNSGDAVTVSFNPAFTGVIYAGNSGGGVVSINGGTEFTPQSNVSYALNPIAVTNCTSFYSKTTAAGQRGWISVAFRNDGTQVYNSSDVFVDVDTTLDSPTNYEADSGNNGGNYATWNPLDKGTSTVLSEGNLKFRGGVSSAHRGVRSTIMPTSKMYAEMTLHAAQTGFGLANASADLDTHTLATGKWAFYSGEIRSNGTGLASVTAASVGDIIQIAYDPENNKAWIGLNNTWYSSSGATTGNPSTGANATFTIDDDVFVMAHSYNDSALTVNFGANPFAYTPPTGFKSLCTQNLDDPLIVDPSTAMDVTKWTGDGSSSRAITGLNMSPDLLWVKRRNSALDHFLWDSVRGVTKELYSNQNYEEGTTTNKLESLDSNGFTVKNNSAVNANNDTYVAWAWDAGSSNTSISVGGLNSSVYNQDQQWTNGWSGQSGTSGRVPTNGFNGDLSNWAFAGNNGANEYVEYSFTAIDVNTSLEFYLSFDAGGSQRGQLWVNDTNVTSQLGAGNAQWYTVTGQSTLSKIKILTTATNYYVNLHAVRVDGKILVDDNITPPSVPSIASTVRANPTAGFSIVNYTGNGTIGAKVGHGLNANVAVYFVKNRSSAANWAVLGHALNDAFGGSNKYLVLNSTGAAGNAGQGPGDSSTIELWNDATNNANGNNYLCLAFAPVEGYSAFGSYVSNNSTDGPFVYLGFQPKLIIWKNLEANHGWYMYDDARDPDNPMSKYLAVHDSIAEGDPGGVMDVLSNGFKVRNTGFDMNTGSNRILYMAWAESPFKYNRAR